jgi:DNA-binding response OmpR family regulator
LRQGLAEVVTLALHHGAYRPRVAPSAKDATVALQEWSPHLAIIHMDLAQGAILDRLEYTAPEASRIPLIALTRRGDLQTKLAACICSRPTRGEC